LPAIDVFVDVLAANWTRANRAMTRDGYFLLKGARVLGARLHVHWSAVAVSVGLLAAWHRQPGLALEAVACYFGLILLHEAGHAAMALRLGYRALDIQLSLFHGRCWYEQPDTLREEATVAWGGVLAQLAIAIPLVALAQVPSFASTSMAGIAIAAFGYFSLAMVVLNLAPVRGLDGAIAWRLLPILAGDLRAHRAAGHAVKIGLPASSGSRAPSRQARAAPAVAARGPASARWLAAECARLGAAADITWPEIAGELNPEHDRHVGALVQRVRASYMGAPRKGLAAIETGCVAVLAENDEASGVDALTQAVGGLESLVKMRW
jgi:Zn-dependent protease